MPKDRKASRGEVIAKTMRLLARSEKDLDEAIDSMTDETWVPIIQKEYNTYIQTIGFLVRAGAEVPREVIEALESFNEFFRDSNAANDSANHFRITEIEEVIPGYVAEGDGAAAAEEGVVEPTAADLGEGDGAAAALEPDLTAPGIMGAMASLSIAGGGS